MRSPFGNADAVAREIGGSFRPGVDKIVRTKFPEWARAVYGDFKVAEQIAADADVDVRTARRWLACEYDPSIGLVTVMLRRTFEKE